MKRLRKVLSLLLSLAMLLGIVGGLGISTFAGVEELSFEVCDEMYQQLRSNLPDTIKIDMSEAEFAHLSHEKYNDLFTYIKNNIEERWKTAGLNLDEINNLMDISYGLTYPFSSWTVEEFRTFEITFRYNYIDFEHNCCPVASMDIVFNNTNKYNKADEEYVKGLKIDEEKKYFEIDFKDFVNADFILFDSIVEKYYGEQINDDTIEVKVKSGIGGSGGLSFWSGHHYGKAEKQMAIFKNGILYDLRTLALNRYLIPVFYVPSAIPEDEINDYVINQVKTAYPDCEWLCENVSIKQGFTERNEKIEYPDGYTYSYSEGYDNIVIKRELPPADEAIIADGTDTEYTIGSDKGVSIHCAYPLEEFISVSVNGKTVDKSNYSLADGSTVLTFKPSYLNTLTAGNYAVALHYTIGTVETALNIKEANSQTPNKLAETQQKPQASSQGQKETAKSPSTGNDSGMTIAISFAAFSACGMAYGVLKKKKAVL